VNSIDCGVHQKSYEQTLQNSQKGRNMVYCTKCGTNNAEGATVCVNCGAPLYGTSAEGKPYWGHRQYAGEYYGFYRRSGALATLIIGIAIVFVGFSFLLNETFNIRIPWWEIILIFLGVWFIARAAMRMKRRR
jgi:hypothetical protein